MLFTEDVHSALPGLTTHNLQVSGATALFVGFSLLHSAFVPRGNLVRNSVLVTTMFDCLLSASTPIAFREV